MSKRLTNEIFINRSKLTHTNNMYDYSLVEYNSSTTKVKIICKKHGIFEQVASIHMNGSNCPKCFNVKTSIPEQFIFFYLNKLPLKIYNQYKILNYIVDIYIPELNLIIEYDGVYYHKKKYIKDLEKNNRIKDENINLIRIREFGLQYIDNCYNILLKRGNDKENLELTIEYIINFINKTYNKKFLLEINYDFDKNEVINILKNKEISNSMVISHPEDAKHWHPTKNGTLKPEYFTKGSNKRIWWLCNNGHEYESFINNKGKCRKCLGVKKLTTEEFIEKVKIIHNNKYTYENSVYVNTYTKLKINCPQHGSFLQSANDHISGYGCPNCCKNKKLTTETFIEKCILVHNNKYDYSYVIYVNNTTKVKIICNEHGIFEQVAATHIQGSGCQKCAILKKYKNN